METLKLTKKALKQYAENEEAYYFTGNVYAYENIVYYLQSLIYKNNNKRYKSEDIEEIKTNLLKETNKQYYNSMIDLIDSILSNNYDNYIVEQVAYSCGVCGNSGQLHKIRLYNNDNITAQYYIYY